MKAQFVIGEMNIDVPDELLREVCMLLLGAIAPKRDYSKVTSVRKLIKLIEIEKELADDSDGEPAPAAKPKAAPARKPAPVKKPVAKPVRKPPPVEEDSEEESSTEESE